MPITLSVNNRLGNGSVSLPPAELISDVAISKAIDAYAKAAAAARQAHQDAFALAQSGLADAARLDADALADAIERGEPDPGPRHQREADAKVADARRHAEAADIVRARKLEALKEALASESADTWTAELETEYAELAEEWNAKLSEVQELYGRLAAVNSLRQFAAEGHYWTPATPLEARASREPVGLNEALHALQQHTAPAEAQPVGHLRVAS